MSENVKHSDNNAIFHFSRKINLHIFIIWFVFLKIKMVFKSRSKWTIPWLSWSKIFLEFKKANWWPEKQIKFLKRYPILKVIFNFKVFLNCISQADWIYLISLNLMTDFNAMDYLIFLNENFMKSKQLLSLDNIM